METSPATESNALAIQSDELDRRAHSWDTVEFPATPAEQDEFRKDRERDLICEYREWLVVPGIELQENDASFDRFLIDYAAEQHGAGLLACDLVSRRMVAWERVDMRDGERKLTRFYAALLKHARIIRQKSKRTIGPVDHYAYQLFGKELKVLRERLIALRLTQNRSPQFSDAEQIINSDRATFWRLFRSIASLRAFQADRPNDVDIFIKGVGGGPKEFAIEWLAWWDGRSPKKLKDTLSIMRKA